MAEPLVVEIPHDLGQVEARRRFENGFGRIREQIGGKGLVFQERWDGNRLFFEAGALGQKVRGHLDVMDKSVRMEVHLPWILAGIAQKLQGRLRKEGQLLLGKR